MKGQLSAEMLIVLAIILGLALIAFTQMSKSTKDVGAAVDAKTNQLVAQSSLAPPDVRCSADSDCTRFNASWECNTMNGYCQ